ncbi:MAG: hypothetical protein N2253_09160 [Bacteroidia bacterium]|nr:hypothetical protein [Bacteroidia bacterium]
MECSGFCCTPADWKPGNPAIVRPPLTLPESKADEAQASQYTTYHSWYLRLAQPK